MARKSSSSSSSGTSMTRSSPQDTSGVQSLPTPEIDIASLMPSDLFSVSSSAPQMETAEADNLVEQITKQRNSMRVASANLDLASDVATSAIKWQNLQGKVIDYRIAGINNQAKLIDEDTAYVKLDIRKQINQQAEISLEQAQITTDGMQALSQPMVEVWVQRLKLEESKAKKIQIKALEAEDELAKLSGS